LPSSLPGGLSRVRIIMKLGGYANDPCAPYEFGETEDYCIHLGFKSPLNPGEDSVEKRSDDIKQVVLQEVQSEEKVTIDYGIKVYPNPVSEMMSVEVKEANQIVKMELFTIDGQSVMNIDPATIENRLQVNVGHLMTGMYTLRTLYTDGEVVAKKVIIQQ